MLATGPHISRVREAIFLSLSPLPPFVFLHSFIQSTKKLPCMCNIFLLTARNYDHGRLIIVRLAYVRSLLLHCLYTIKSPGLPQTCINSQNDENSVSFISHTYTDLMTASIGSGRDNGLAQARQRFHYGLLLLF